MTQMLLPALTVLCLLYAAHRRVPVYDAFVRGAKEGLMTLLSIVPYLASILSATALLRGSGAMDALITFLTPVLGAAGLPAETAGVILLRPLSGSAAIAAVNDVLLTCGAGETVFFTASLYLGAAGVRRSRYALGAAMAAYASGGLAAALLCR